MHLAHPAGAIDDGVEHELTFASALSETGFVVSFKPLEPGAALGAYRVECTTDKSKASASFLVDHMTPTECTSWLVQASS